MKLIVMQNILHLLECHSLIREKFVNLVKVAFFPGGLPGEDLNALVDSSFEGWFHLGQEEFLVFFQEITIGK